MVYGCKVKIGRRGGGARVTDNKSEDIDNNHQGTTRRACLAYQGRNERGCEKRRRSRRTRQQQHPDESSADTDGDNADPDWDGGLRVTESTGGETDDGEDSDAENSLGTGSNRGQRRSKTPRSSGHSTAGASAWKYGPGMTGKSRWKVHVCPYPDCNHTAEGYPSRMRRHVLTVHEHKNIACTVCKKTYNSRHYMQSHRYKIHGRQSPEKSKAEWRATYEEWLASEPKKK